MADPDAHPAAVPGRFEEIYDEQVVPIYRFIYARVGNRPACFGDFARLSIGGLGASMDLLCPLPRADGAGTIDVGDCYLAEMLEDACQLCCRRSISIGGNVIWRVGEDCIVLEVARNAEQWMRSAFDPAANTAVRQL